MGTAYGFLDRLGIKKVNSGACYGKWIEEPEGDMLVSINPATEKEIARVKMAGVADYELIMEKAERAFKVWSMMPAPERGLIVRELGQALAYHKEDLARLISLEMGKIVKEGGGEVQEPIDLEKITGGRSRGVSGHLFHSERRGYGLETRYNPLGPIGIITASNFPAAVWGWNAFVALVEGDVIIWKPSPQMPLCAIAVQNICNSVFMRHDRNLEGVVNLVIGHDAIIGERLIGDNRVPLISFTGSTEVGRYIAGKVSGRLGKYILELGGNNPSIILNDADIDLALEAVFFSAIGTGSQRCTTNRRVYPHQDIYEDFTGGFVRMCQNIRFGDPLDPKTLVGPLINEKAIQKVLHAAERAEKEGGKILLRGKRLDRPGFFLTPTVVEMPAGKNLPIALEETFGPIIYVSAIESLEEGIALSNESRQLLAASLFSESRKAEYIFRGPMGVRAGILNINCGTSGAESTTPFGGNYDTGWGREGGGDAWRNYVRESSGATNFMGNRELAQGIDFFENQKEESK